MEQELYFTNNNKKVPYRDFMKKMINLLVENNLYRTSEKVLKLLCTGCNNS